MKNVWNAWKGFFKRNRKNKQLNVDRIYNKMVREQDEAEFAAYKKRIGIDEKTN